ncbi:MAG: hypothetical protein HY293_10210 [Planctomycetes bacterium]|nr:hypothetical protein [Planctomycetota bacterium]
MTHHRYLLTAVAILSISLAGSAQDYKPFSRACVVCQGETRPGWTAQYYYEGTNYVVGFCSSPCRTKFLQSPATCMASALAAFKAGNPKKEKKVSAEATGPCDQKKIIKAPYCVSCARELAKEDVLPNKLCKKCETKPAMVEFCVKMGDAEDRARISYKCDSCAATAEIESEFKHEAACRPKVGGGLKKVCSKSGMSPHATEAK